MMNHIYTGDSLAVLRTLPSESVQCCITSPPYYGLRDYGVEGQIGLEETPEAYVEKLVQVFREVRRVLRADGTCWVNLGDTYSSGTQKTQVQPSGRVIAHTAMIKGKPMRAPVIEGMKPKDLIGIPWMVAFALRADGWYLRSDIIWAKSNAMPESVTDRPTKAHEYMFLLAKSERYYYDADAIREPHTTESNIRDRGKEGVWASSALLTPIGKGMREWNHPQGRNKRTVWTIASQPYSEAHFATFPPKLIEPCVLAGTSPRACEHCLAPWERITEHDFIPQQDVRDPAKLAKASIKGLDKSNGWGDTPRGTVNVITAGWRPTCTCANNTGAGKCIVLDPFLGAGTVALVALQHGRGYLGIELNPAYVTLAENRIATVQQHLWTCGSDEVAV